MIGSVVCFSTMDLIVKYLDNVPFGQVLFMRFFFLMIPILNLITRYNEWILDGQNIVITLTDNDIHPFTGKLKFQTPKKNRKNPNKSYKDPFLGLYK